MCFCFDVRERRARPSCCKGSLGQATVEAAAAAPAILLGILLLIQPAIVLYDRMVMEAAAFEACRALMTMNAGGEADVRSYIERRLAAVPESEIFHVGAWVVEFTGGSASADAYVHIEHAVRPLPIIGSGLGFLGMTDSSGMYVQSVEKRICVRDAWLVGSKHGIDAAAWITRWDEKV